MAARTGNTALVRWRKTLSKEATAGHTIRGGESVCLNQRVPRKPGVLLVTTSPLLPPNAGGRIYTWGTTEPLADRFDYHLIALATDAEIEEFARDQEKLTAEYLTVFRTFHLFPRPVIPGHMSRVDAFRSLWFHTRNGLPLMDVSYYSSEVVDKARDLMQSAPIDAIEVDHSQLAYVRRFIPELPAILVNHNIEGHLHPFWMTDRWSLPELVVWRAFAAMSRRNTRKVEIENWYGFASKLFISERDAAQVSPDCPKHFLPVPMQVGPDREINDSSEIDLLWLGGFDWPPNLEGISWFLKEVWPRLGALDHASFRLHIVGANPPEELTDVSNQGDVMIHGYVEDITEIRDRADVFIAPLLSGSGVRVKVVEALASGLPIVATSKGAEGLAVEDGRDLFIADSPQSFAERVQELALSADKRRLFSKAGQSYIRRVHDPKKVAAIKEEALLNAMESERRPAG